MEGELNFHENSPHTQAQLADEQIKKYFLAEKLQKALSQNDSKQYFNADTGDRWEV